MYAAWLEGAMDADIHAIKQAMERRPAARAAIAAVNAGTNRTKLIVIRPLKSPEFGSSLAVGNGERSKPLNREQIKWRRGWDRTYDQLIKRPLFRIAYFLFRSHELCHKTLRYGHIVAGPDPWRQSRARSAPQ